LQARLIRKCLVFVIAARLPANVASEYETNRQAIVETRRFSCRPTAGPFQVFVRAAELFVRDHPNEGRPYIGSLISTTRHRMIQTNCGLALRATGTYTATRGPIDTLRVAGGGAL
jgi:hypothetical protein